MQIHETGQPVILVKRFPVSKRDPSKGYRDWYVVETSPEETSWTEVPRKARWFTSASEALAAAAVGGKSTYGDAPQGARTVPALSAAPPPMGTKQQPGAKADEPSITRPESGLVNLTARNLDPDWEARAADIAMSIFRCPECLAWGASMGVEPYWVGPRYAQQRVVLLARNPADDDSWRKLLRVRVGHLASAEPSKATLCEYSGFMVQQVPGWNQFKRAFAPVMSGLCGVEEVAWLNVVPFPTIDNSSPTNRMVEHGVREHLSPMLDVLSPTVVIARYKPSREYAESLSRGRWLVIPLDGLVASQQAKDEGHRRLRALLRPKP